MMQSQLNLPHGTEKKPKLDTKAVLLYKMLAGRHRGGKMPFCPSWPWPCHPNSSQRGTRHVFCVNLLQISSAILGVFAENTVFGPWWPLTLTFKVVQAREQTRLPCEYGTSPFSGSGDISYTALIDW